MNGKSRAQIRALLTRVGLVVTTATMALIGPATAIADARLAGNHNEVMLG